MTNEIFKPLADFVQSLSEADRINFGMTAERFDLVELERMKREAEAAGNAKAVKFLGFAASLRTIKEIFGELPESPEVTEENSRPKGANHA
jgi:hypothetical protein